MGTIAAAEDRLSDPAHAIVDRRQSTMSDSRGLTEAEKRWLLAISRGPLKKTAAERSIPQAIVDMLIAKRLVHWDIDSLLMTTKGEIAVALLRSLQC
ncbi:MAG TPA: hypothetical protein VGH81_10240 [Rudaea sp.]